MSVVTVHTRVAPVRRLGFEQWRAEVVGPGGVVLFTSTRWSAEQARTDAARWCSQHAAPETPTRSTEL